MIRMQADSWWLLLVDLLSARALVWLASVGRGADLKPDVHHYFFDRYRRLAAYHRAHGRLAKAQQLEAKAQWHAEAGGADGPPYAAAMAMPRPRPFIRTDAVSTKQLDRPDNPA
jgi:hypothetical protein